jgi:hypothetical protein
MKTTKSTLNAQSQSSRDLPRSVELIKISEAQERLGMTQGSFMTLRKSLGIAKIGKMVNWPTVIQRIEQSQNPN